LPVFQASFLVTCLHALSLAGCSWGRIFFGGRLVKTEADFF
jgi:hypothetical protein